MHLRPAALFLAALLAASPAFAVKRALFDNAHAEQAGNADWVIDDNMPTPSPAQSGIGPATPGTYWTGAISSWGVDLVQRGYTVATNTSALTYGNGANPNDLANFDVLIVDEPNTVITSAEAAAIFAFVQAGGGLVGIADHNGSDRNNDGIDSPAIWNALDPTRLFGVHFGVAGDANNNIVQTSTNVNPAAADSVTHGPVGVVAGLAFHNGTTMTLYPAANPTVRGEVWMTGLPQTSLTGVMAASVVYGAGHVAFFGDSSPADDGTANPGNSSIYDGWGEVGASDSTLLMNATLWATRRAPAGDTTPPTVNLTSPNGGEDWKAGSTHDIVWSATDNVGVTSVDLAWSSNGGTSFANPIATGIANGGTYSWAVPDAPTGAARVRVLARDAAGNARTDSSSANFTISLWSIVVSAGPGGNVTPSGPVSVVQGGSAGFSITPSAHYHIADVLVDVVSVGTVASYTFTNVTANHTLGATFAIDTFPVGVSVVGSGAVAKNPDQPAYEYGTSVQLAATPAAGWVLGGWSGDAGGSANPVSVWVDAAKSVTASFVDAQAPAVTLVSPTGGESWNVGTVHAITWMATDNDGIDSVNVDWSGQGAAGPWVPVAHGLANSGAYDWTVPAPNTINAFVRVTAFDRALHATSATSDSAFRIFDPAVGVDGEGPAVLALARPAPNPGFGMAMLRFSLPAAGLAQLEVVDASGRRVWARAATLGAGAHAWNWDGRDSSGQRAGAGIYFVRLVTPWGVKHERLTWMR